MKFFFFCVISFSLIICLNFFLGFGFLYHWHHLPRTIPQKFSIFLPTKRFYKRLVLAIESIFVLTMPMSISPPLSSPY